MRRPWISMRLASAAGILLVSQVAYGTPPESPNAGPRAFAVSSLMQSLGSAVLVPSPDFGAKLLQARRGSQSASSATRAIALLAAAIVIAASRFLYLATGPGDRKRRFVFAGRGAPTRAPPAVQLA